MLTQLSLRIQRHSDPSKFAGLLIHFNYLFLCVYMSVPICVHVCVGVSTCALWKSETDKEYLSKFFILFVRRGHLKLAVTVWPDSRASRSPDPLISVSPALGVQVAASVPGVLHRCWGSKSGPHGCAAHTFLSNLPHPSNTS